MENMYNAAMQHEDADVELACPQCRRSIADMQHDARVKRITQHLRVTSDVAEDVIAYENLATEVAHLCACGDDGAPYFMMPGGAVARIMSRDRICEVIEHKSGRGVVEAFRRNLRAEKYDAAWRIVLDGYVGVLRHDAKLASARPFLELMRQNLTSLANSDGVAVPLASGRDRRKDLFGCLDAADEHLKREMEQRCGHRCMSDFPPSDEPRVPAPDRPTRRKRPAEAAEGSGDGGASSSAPQQQQATERRVTRRSARRP